MIHLFEELCHTISKATTRKYSTSFSLGIQAISPRIRTDIYAVYGFVRLADEIVDSFHGYNKGKLLKQLRDETFEAIAAGISINPILHSFQRTVNKYQIDHQHIDTFLKSMEMDLQQIEYNDQKYDEYILGSAEVVGLMCLKIFVDGNQQQYEQLKPAAMKLGSAFQKVNFLRDLRDDYVELGRTYFPGVRMEQFDTKAKQQIEQEIDTEFREALAGIKKLPTQARFGVYLAYVYYISLFRKIQRIPAEVIVKKRVRIPNAKKLSLVMSSYFQYKMQMI
jgi:phytoene synthase